MKAKLLVVNLWGLGDLVIATPFLQAASQTFEVVLLAKPYAKDLQARFWSRVKVVPFVAPWTAFHYSDKYRLLRWPWRAIFRLRKQLLGEHFDFALSARWDPRDHLLLALTRAKARLGFPRLGSSRFLSRPLARPDPREHQYEYWRVLGHALGLEVPPREKLQPPPPPGNEILVHTGAGQPVRVWPLNRYRTLVTRLRQQNHRVRLACDPDQQTWWADAGEPEVAVPSTVVELLTLIDHSGAFIGNDSGPGHLAALCGVPTFTLFGPQLPEWFAPLHPASESLEGKACPYKPCSDYCQFPLPYCMVNSGVEEVWARVQSFINRNWKGRSISLTS
ncbi:Glycosyl transferase family 9 [Verrucomicrobia bacterium]|nr:Glycosyl transferase family 9 [Verrucomicrobiota bacterium]